MDESAAWGVGPEEAAAAHAAAAAGAAQYLGEGVQYHCVPLEDLFSEEGASEARRERLRQLVRVRGAGRVWAARGGLSPPAAPEVYWRGWAWRAGRTGLFLASEFEFLSLNMGLTLALNLSLQVAHRPMPG